MKQICILVLSTILIAPGAICQTADNRNVNLVEQDIKTLKTRIHALESSSRSLSEEVEYYGGQLELLRIERENAIRDKERTEKDLEAIRERLATVTAKIEKKRAYLNQRIMELYRKEDFMFLEMLMTPGSESELVHAMNGFLFLAEKDRKALTDLSTLRSEQQAYQADLGRKNRYLERKVAELTQLHKQYRETYQEKRSTYRRIRNEAASYSKLLDERSALLQDLMQILQSGRAVENAGVSMERFKNLLSLPLNGEIVERFGRVRNRKFGTWLMNNGVTIRTTEGTPVRAFYDGVVVYAGWYKSYGRVIILDHGDNYYTFYAHLKDFSVTINEAVTTGDMIAESGNTASVHGDVLHFELWHKREPEDPMKWVKRR